MGCGLRGRELVVVELVRVRVQEVDGRRGYQNAEFTRSYLSNSLLGVHSVALKYTKATLTLRHIPLSTSHFPNFNLIALLSEGFSRQTESRRPQACA